MTSQITLNNSELKHLANTIRSLSLDSVNKAKSGHIGTALGAADMLAALFANYLIYNPQKPQWKNRDRFILSAGHSCAMLYSMLHLVGYEKFTLDSLKNLRQINSITSGHPEKETDAGIEVTTGPLGEGVSMAVGIALGEKILNAKYKDIINHLTYVMVGDGCLMEGVAYEALSLAGNLGLNKLVVIYDKNNITIDGNLELSNTENIKLRMESFGFNVVEINGHNFDEINKALTIAKNNHLNSTKPIFIISNSVIGFGSSKHQQKSSAHGYALTKEDTIEIKKALEVSQEEFYVPKETQEICKTIVNKQINSYKEWKENLSNNSNKEQFLTFTNTDFATIFNQKEVKVDIENLAKEIIEKKPSLATRVASGKVLEILTKYSENFIGGSCDLSSSNNTINKNSIAITSLNGNGNYLHYGVREHAMGAIMNGLACYESGLFPYGGTFLTFSDFMRPAIRLSALMEVPLLYILTRDNITLGGDGPTHQPIEHIDSLRLIPNLEVLRPCDLIETIECYEIILSNKKTPTALILGRGDVATLRENYDYQNNQVKKGGYILKGNKNATINLVSSGSELSIVVEVAKELEQKGLNVKVVSMPSLNRFAVQEESYKKAVLGDENNLNIVIEAKNIMGYKEILGNNTISYGIKTFGKSGEPKDLLNYFGFTKEKIIQFVIEKTKV